jgi:hypothetical protein
MLIGNLNGNVKILYKDNMKEGVAIPLFFKILQHQLFFESMRQQLFYLDLFNLERVKSLTCPFKGRRGSCCGFGYYLQNLWSAIPTEKRRGLKRPSRVCFNTPLSSPYLPLLGFFGT